MATSKVCGASYRIESSRALNLNASAYQGENLT